MNSTGMTPNHAEWHISANEAVKIAQTDAEKVYRDLSIYRVKATLERDGWHVVYEPKNRSLNAGGPRYLIEPTSGRILDKRYQQ